MHNDSEKKCACLLLSLIVCGIVASLSASAIAATSQKSSTPAQQYLSFALKSCDKVEANLKEITRIATIVADRYLAGGCIGFPWNSQGLQPELIGRSGGMMGMSSFLEGRTDQEKANDVAIISWEQPPFAKELPKLQALHQRGCYIIGFGPKLMPELSDYEKECDVWFDTGFGAADRIVEFSKDNWGGRGNALVNTLNGWTLTAEIVAALTRKGKMPTMWKSYAYEDGVEWGKRYSSKRFHDDLTIAPIAPGGLGKAFLRQIRHYLQRFEKSQLPQVKKITDLIQEELKQGQKTIVNSVGHMCGTYVGKYEDKAWGMPFDFQYNVEQQVNKYVKETPDGALVLRLGYCGIYKDEVTVFDQKKQRVMLISVGNPRPEWKLPPNLAAKIDMGWAFGDACVTPKGYPIRILPPSGIMQIVAYEAINVEVLSRLAKQR